MKTILLLGDGKIGGAIAALLADTGDYRVVVADRDAAALARLAPQPRVTTRVLDAADEAAVTAAAAGLGAFAVVSACPFHLTVGIARAAKAAGAHMLDLTEDVASTAAVTALAEGAETAFIPQCGLAPGYISIAAGDLARRFDELESLRLRVGALPRYPANALKYALTWSTAGVINEYCQPCDAIVDGRRVKTHALEGLESLTLDGVDYEAFNTSGGLGTLCDSLAGKVRDLDYRSIRYPGHRDIMKLLIDDLGLRKRTDLLAQVLEGALPNTDQDVVLVSVSATGRRDGRLTQESLVNRIHGRRVGDRWVNAIQITTASGLCAVLDLLAEGRLAGRGLVRQEDIAMSDFLRNRFGATFRTTDDPIPDSDGLLKVA